MLRYLPFVPVARSRVSRPFPSLSAVATISPAIVSPSPETNSAVKAEAG